MRSRAIGLVSLAVLWMSGCGGSSGPAPSTVKVTISGLVGKLVLQNNGGDDLAVSANGAFNFGTRVANGARYSVTILTQPPGPTCAIADGAGTATADVTNVTVTCTTDPATLFVPVAATAFQGVTDPKANGLYVVSTRSASEPLIQVIGLPAWSLGMQRLYNLDAQGKVSAEKPSQLIYTTLSASSDNHVWSLDLSGNSTLVPKQLSNLSLPFRYGTDQAPMSYCASHVIAKNLNDPASAFLLVAVPNATDQSCTFNKAGFKWYLIHASDGPTTDPVAIPSLSGPVLPLYRPDGMLAGLVAIDATSQLNFYPDETFANPRVLLTNVFTFRTPSNGRPGVATDPTYSFLDVESVGSAPQKNSLYRIDESGTLSPTLYEFANFQVFSQWVLDADACYFLSVDNAQQGSVVRISNDGQSVQVLARMSGINTDSLPVLVGGSGSNLWLSQAQSQTQVVQTLSKEGPGAFTTVSSDTDFPSLQFLNGDVFLTLTHHNPDDFSIRTVRSQILDSSANVLQPMQAGSEFLGFGSAILQVSGVTGPQGHGGGTLSALDLSHPASPQPVVLKTAAGAAYTFQTDTAYEFQHQIASTVVALDYAVPQGNSYSSGATLIIDLAKGTVAPITFPTSFATVLTDDYDD
jgi:hypothetical protein